MTTQSRATNFLQLSLAEFKRGTKVFTPKRRKLGPALLAFESGFLSIESGEVTSVMRAAGEWHGRATIPAETLRAISTVPPNHDPLTISYADGHLLVGNLTIVCQWQPLSQAFIHNLESPSFIDLLAMGRALPRSEMNATELGKRISSAAEQAEKRIRRALSQLAELGVTENELRALVETKINARLADKA